MSPFVKAENASARHIPQVLAGQKALVTGADSGTRKELRLRWAKRVPMWWSTISHGRKRPRTSLRRYAAQEVSLPMRIEPMSRKRMEIGMLTEVALGSQGEAGRRPDGPSSPQQ
jgi:hypothetical protein